MRIIQPYNYTVCATRHNHENGAVWKFWLFEKTLVISDHGCIICCTKLCHACRPIIICGCLSPKFLSAITQSLITTISSLHQRYINKSARARLLGRHWCRSISAKLGYTHNVRALSKKVVKLCVIDLCLQKVNVE